MELNDILNIDIQKMTPEEIAARDTEIDRAAQIAEEEQKQKRYEKSGVPYRYWHESLDTYQINNDDQKKAAEAIVKFINCVRNGRPRILILLGEVGTGKTHLCCAAIRELGGQYMTAAEMVEEIRHAKAFNADASEKQIIEKYAGSIISVMDEVGRGISDTQEKYMLYNYINTLYNLKGSAIITSNFTKKDFIQYAGAAVADRLIEYGEFVEIGGNSYRWTLRAKE